jgi:hypothetical protein
MGLSDDEIYRVLKVVVEGVGGKEVAWRVEGSANLRVQGVEVEVNDVDILTTPEGYAVLKEALKEFVVSDKWVDEKKKQSLICDVGGVELEVLWYEEKELNMFEAVQDMQWKGLALRVLPLEDAKRFYEMIGKKEKVLLLEEHLKNK